MRVLVLGAGVIGITTAYYLVLAGHDVTVIDQENGAALDTSFANAGQISPGYASPWAAPGIPLKALRWMLQKHSPLSIRLDGSLFQLSWMWKMYQNCSAPNYAINKERMVRLAEYSRDTLVTLRTDTGIEYESRQGGTMQLFRTQRQVDDAEKDIKILSASGVPYQLLTRDELRRYEPALDAVKHKLAGSLRLPTDETGDCHLFTKRLAKMAEKLGVQFQYATTIDGLSVQSGKIDGVRCGTKYFTADKYVVAMGSYSKQLLHGVLDIPIYPLKGYSITVPIKNELCAPVSTVLDESYKIAVTRFNNRIRVGGMAEIVGFDKKLKSARRRTLEMVVNDLFPGAGKTVEANFWTGLRPMTPDGTPIVGPTKISNLYLNTGHGTLGWTMSCGSAKVLSDLISGRRTDIAVNDLSLSRYGRG